MSNTTAVNPYITQLASIQLILSHYAYSSIAILGNIGSILNILILTRPNCRRNSCSAYILAESVTNLIVLNILLTLRYLVDSNIDLVRTSAFCKFEIYSIQVGLGISRVYIVLACIDRWALTSRNVHRRAFAQMKVAKILIPITSIIWPIMYIHVAIYDDIVKGQCVSISKSYSMFYNIYNMILNGILIPLVMLISGLLCIRNVKQLQQRVQPLLQTLNMAFITEQNPRQNLFNKKNYDYQLLLMVLVEQFIYLFTNIPFISYLFYSTITLNWTKSSVQISIDNFFHYVIQLVVYLNFTLTFYIYTLTGAKFRKELKRLLFHNCLANMIRGIRPNT